MNVVRLERVRVVEHQNIKDARARQPAREGQRRRYDDERRVPHQSRPAVQLRKGLREIWTVGPLAARREGAERPRRVRRRRFLRRGRPLQRRLELAAGHLVRSDAARDARLARRWDDCRLHGDGVDGSVPEPRGRDGLRDARDAVGVQRLGLGQD